MDDSASPDVRGAPLSSPDSTSCSVCAERKRSATDDAIGYSISPFQDLEKSATGGCIACGAILEGLLAWGVSKQPNYAEGDVQWMNTARNYPGPLHIKVKSKTDVKYPDSFSVDLLFYSHQDEYDERSIFGSGRSVPLNSSSDSTFALARHWLDDCLENHPLCNKANRDSMPARLVDIGLEQDNSAIRLIEVLETNLKYLALTYCWGSSLPLKTEQSSLESRQSGIPWSRLPKTFQDALTITRKLGFRYIWIDSLCIIQDDQSDWEAESARMGVIYENAVLTISAAFGADTTVGCFHDRTHWSSRMVQVGCTFDKPTFVGEDRISITYSYSEGSRQTIYVERCLEHESISHEVRFSQMKQPPLFDRAWAFQERLLSPRILQYTNSELCWECRTHMDCECGGINARIWNTRNDNGRYFMDKLSRYFENDQGLLSRSKVGKPLPKGYVENIRLLNDGLWGEVTREYNQRKLSYPTDKLAAFSAIAKLIKRPELGAYCAGLWEAHLPTALLWYRLRHYNSDDADPLHRLVPYSAPSWSWASITGDTLSFATNGFYGSATKYHIDAEVKEVSCPPMGLDPTGQVSGGYILLEAPLVRIKWRVFEAEYHRSSWTLSLEFLGVESSIGFEYKPEESLASLADFPETDVVLFVHTWEERRMREAEIPEDLFLLIISSCDARVPDPSISSSDRLHQASELHGLMLKKSQDVAGAYERLGPYLGSPNSQLRFGSLAKVTEVKIV